MFRPTQIPTMGALSAATPVVGSGLSGQVMKLSLRVNKKRWLVDLQM